MKPVRTRSRAALLNAAVFSVGIVGLFAPGLCTAQGSGTPAGALEIDPTVTHMGRFSLVDPLESEVSFGETVFRVLSSDPWQLEVTMPEPIRRLDDGQELVRLDHLDPGIPLVAEILAERPCVVTSGPGSAEWQAFTLNWRELETAIARILHPAVSPGSYRAVFLIRLLDSQGVPLTDCTTVTLQFEVLSWVHLSDNIPLIELLADDGTAGVGILESEPTYLLISGNAAWELRVVGTGELISDDGLTGLPQPAFTVCVPQSVLGMNSDIMGVGCVDLAPDPVWIARGDPATSIATAAEEIPVTVRLQTEEPLPAGEYRASLVFEVREQEPLP